MKIKNQVTCKELSQKMCELGFEQEGYYWWRIYIKSNEATLTTDDYCKSNPKDYTHYVAYTVAEGLEKLPNKIKDSFLRIIKMDKGTYVVQYCYQNMKVDREFGDKNLANAVSKMLIWLKENKYA